MSITTYYNLDVGIPCRVNAQFENEKSQLNSLRRIVVVPLYPNARNYIFAAVQSPIKKNCKRMNEQSFSLSIFGQCKKIPPFYNCLGQGGL